MGGQTCFSERWSNLAVNYVAAPTEVFTTYYREIVYNTEHTVHHLALIKVALIEMKLNIVDKKFGMAGSTIKYKRAMLKIQNIIV